MTTPQSPEEYQAMVQDIMGRLSNMESQFYEPARNPRGQFTGRDPSFRGLSQDVQSIINMRDEVDQGLDEWMKGWLDELAKLKRAEINAKRYQQRQTTERANISREAAQERYEYNLELDQQKAMNRRELESDKHIYRMGEAEFKAEVEVNRRQSMQANDIQTFQYLQAAGYIDPDFRFDQATMRQWMASWPGAGSAIAGGPGSGGGALMNPGRNALLGGQAGNIMASWLYGGGSMLSEIGLEGGKDASRMASVARGAGALANAVSMLGIATGPTTLAIMSATLGVSTFGLAMAKIAQKQNEAARIEDITGLGQAGLGVGMLGLQGEFGMSTADIGRIPMLTQRNMEYWGNLGTEQQMQWAEVFRRTQAFGYMGQEGLSARQEAAGVFGMAAHIPRGGNLQTLDQYIGRITQGWDYQTAAEFRASVLNLDPVGAQRAIAMQGGELRNITSAGLTRTGLEMFGTTYRQETGEFIHPEAIFQDQRNRGMVSLGWGADVLRRLGTFGDIIAGNEYGLGKKAEYLGGIAGTGIQRTQPGVDWLSRFPGMGWLSPSLTQEQRRHFDELYMRADLTPGVSPGGTIREREQGQILKRAVQEGFDFSEVGRAIMRSLAGTSFHAP